MEETKMKINLNGEDSKVIKQNDTYTLIDNTDLNGLIVSKTILHPEKSTTGHNHKGQEEVIKLLLRLHPLMMVKLN